MHESLGDKIRKGAFGIGGSYQDKFDYSVYSGLEKKFEHLPLRGGVIFKSPFKLVNHHSSCSKCHYSFEIDTYGRGCIHNCVYCYAKESLTRHGFWNRPHPMPVDISSVRKVFHTVFETDKKNKWRAILEKRIPLRIGSMSDSFMYMDRKFKVSLELLRILRHYQYPHVIFTRSDLIAEEPYLEQLDTSLSAVQMSISTLRDRETKLLEPGAPNIEARLNALRILRMHNIWTTVRLNPLFPSYPDGYFSDRQSIIERFGSYDQVPSLDIFPIREYPEFLDRVLATGNKTILAGFVRLSRFAILAMEKSLSMPLGQFFRSDIPQDQVDKRFTDKEISYYYHFLSKESHKRGLRFTTCYIGNGIKDYYQYQNLWADSADCCDVKANVDGFKRSAQHVPWRERIKHASCKESAELAKIEEEKADANEPVVREPKQYTRKLQLVTLQTESRS